MLDVDGHAVEVLREASSRAPTTTLLFLHEGLGSARLWRAFPADLAAATGLATFAYSRLGYGASDPVALPRPLTYMEDEARSFLPALRRAAGLDDVILVGHSDGASIALVHAAVAGEGVRALVLLAPHVFVEDVSVASIAAAREAYLHGDLRARLARHHMHVDVAFHGWNGAWLDPGFRSWDLQRFLPAVRVPVLVVQGEDDAYGTRAQVDAIARGVRGPCEVLLLAGCGHAPHQERTAETTNAITGFVRRIMDPRDGR